ncbi:19088_t:CDS:1, partial [Gigaspora margarita]
ALNYLDFHTTPLKIQFQQLQNSTTTNCSILTQPPVFPTKENRTTMAKIILATHQQGIQLKNYNHQWPIPQN